MLFYQVSLNMNIRKTDPLKMKWFNLQQSWRSKLSKTWNKTKFLL